MAKVIIKRVENFSGSALSHNVYLDRKFLGVLKNGSTLDFETSTGAHKLYFEGKKRMCKCTGFDLVINDDTETVMLKTYFDFSGNYIVKYANNMTHLPNCKSEDNNDLKCPKCGSSNLSIVSEVSTSGKDFNTANACCGYLLCGPLGLLLGTAGKGKQQHTDTFWVCKKCGNKFKM